MPPDGVPHGRPVPAPPDRVRNVPPSADQVATPLGAAVALTGAAAGSVAYAAVVSVLARWPSVVRARGAGGAARPVLVGAFALAALIAAAWLWRAGAGGRAPERRLVVALACVGFGAAWVAWGLLEQHVLRTFDVAPGSGAAGAWDALFHGVGVLTAGVGTSTLSAGGLPTSSRSI